MNQKYVTLKNRIFINADPPPLHSQKNTIFFYTEAKSRFFHKTLESRRPHFGFQFLFSIFAEAEGFSCRRQIPACARLRAGRRLRRRTPEALSGIYFHCGGGEIRTHEALSGLPHFEGAPSDPSGPPPG